MTTLRIAVTGTRGQVVRSLIELGPSRDVEVVAVGRPVLDLAAPHTIRPAITATHPDVIVNAAALTDSELAEADPRLADAVNAVGAGMLAQLARELAIPIIHLSTDYVFDGAKAEPYVETDPVTPLSVYGRSKADGEAAVAAAQPKHAILRVAWVYSPFGRNFVKTMLDLARRQSEVKVVADQTGNPTSAADVAEGILAVAHNLVRSSRGAERYGTFHMAGTGGATRAEFAEAIFAISAELGGPTARVTPIKTTDYQSLVRRPADSRLDCSKIDAAHGVALPPWRASLKHCIRRILEQPA